MTDFVLCDCCKTHFEGEYANSPVDPPVACPECGELCSCNGCATDAWHAGRKPAEWYDELRPVMLTNEKCEQLAAYLQGQGATGAVGPRVWVDDICKALDEAIATSSTQPPHRDE
jgi:hypothetical protein